MTVDSTSQSVTGNGIDRELGWRCLRSGENDIRAGPPRLPLAGVARLFAALPPHWGRADRRMVLLTACQLVWEALWQKRLISQLWARALPGAPSRGSSRGLTFPFAWSRRLTISRWARRRPTAAWCMPATIRHRARLRRRSTPRLRVVRYVGAGAGIFVLPHRVDGAGL